MTDARWLDVEDDLAGAVRHFREAARMYAAGDFTAPDPEGYRLAMAFMHAMQCGYTSTETALLRILDMLGEERPSGPDSHRALLTRVGRPTQDRPALVSAELARALEEARRFRHVAMHSYGDFDMARARRPVEAARLIADSLPGDIGAFRRRIDPPDETGNKAG